MARAESRSTGPCPLRLHFPPTPLASPPLQWFHRDPYPYRKGEIRQRETKKRSEEAEESREQRERAERVERDVMVMAIKPCGIE